MSKEQKDESVDDLIDDFDGLGVSSKPKFIANTIIYGEGEESDESSDESYDSSDKRFDELDTQDPHSFPYRTFRITKSKAKKTKGEYKFSKPVGFVEEGEVAPTDTDYSARKSVVVQPFLDNLYKTGFEDESKEFIEDTVSASIALNRPLSLSSRKNNLLHKELQAKKESPIEHKEFGVFWKFNWYDSSNSVVKYDVVKSFYKKLKRYDSEHGTSKAEDFRKICESGIAVPYQELREAAKNHDNTKKLVTDTRLASPDSDVYLSVVDGDTVSFNGIYSAYLRIHGKSETTPTVMSTGYEFTEEKEGDLPLIEGAKLCRGIRVATAKFVKLGIYITEPNFCVMILPEDETVAESFIDKSIKAGGAIIKNAESVALMRNLIASRGLDNIEAVMSDDKPLLTAIPPRVRLTKSHKTPIKFSEGFKAGLGPTEKDFVSFKQMSQSHVHEGVWIDNLSINRAITLKKGFHFKFKGLLTKYLKSEITPVDQKLLLTIISAEDLARVKSAYEAKEKIIQLYKDENLRKADQQALIDYISEHEELEIDDFEAEFLEIIANAEIISLLEDEILDLGEMSEVSSDILRELLYDDEIISLLKEERVLMKFTQFIVNILKIQMKEWGILVL